MARILVIEDNATNLDLMVYLLRAFGHVVSSAADGHAGLAVVDGDRPELIICDVHLPGIDGLEVARRLKADERTRAIPLVAVTALAMVGDRQDVLQSGFDGYISKPITPDRFVGDVEAFLPSSERSAAPRPAATAASPERAAPVGSRGTILVVDDSPLNRELMRSTLEPFGFTVISLNSVAAGLSAARRSRPDVIVSDLHMPDQDGFEFVTRLREDPQLRGVPFIVLSSSVWTEGDRRRLLAMGADRFVQRPIEPRELVAIVEECLHSASA